MRVPVACPMDGGVNRFLAPHDIRDNELYSCKNLYPRFPGHMTTRPATSMVGALNLPSTPGDGYPLLMQFLPDTRLGRVVLYTRAFSKAGIAYDTAMAAYSDINGAFLSDVANASFGAVTPYTPASLAYQGKVYAFGGLGSATIGKILQLGSGGLPEIVDFTFSTSGNESLRPHGVVNYRERFVYFNVAVGFESAFVFADPFNPAAITANALATNGGYGLLNSGDGDRITAGAEIFQTGTTAAQSSLLLLKEWSAFLLQGEPVDSTGSAIQDSLQIIKMPVNCGCVSQETVCKTPYGLIWAGPDDVWFFPEGQVPYRVGTKIRPVLQASPANVRYRWHAVYHDGFYKLAVFSEGQGPTDDDQCGEQWWLDMRSGMPQASPDAWREVKWFGPMVHTYSSYDGTSGEYSGTRCLAIDTRPGADRELYGCEGISSLVAAFTMSYGAESNHDSVCEFDTSGVYLQNSHIDVEIVTKEYKSLVAGNQLAADNIQEKGLQGAELDLHVDAGGQLGWKWILDGGRSVGAEQTVEVTPPSGFLTGTGVMDTTALSDEDAMVPLDPAPTRAVGRSIQLDLYTKPGYYIDSSNDLFEISVLLAPFVPVRVSVPLDHGLYADRDTLATYIATKLTAALAAYAITITSSLAGGKVRFGNGGGYELDFGATYCAAGNQAKVRALAQMLGFTAWDSDYEGLTTVTADTKVFPQQTQRWEINSGMVVQFYTIPRRLL